MFLQKFGCKFKIKISITIWVCLLGTFVNLFKKMELAMGLEPMTAAMNEVAFQQVNEEKSNELT